MDDMNDRQTEHLIWERYKFLFIIAITLVGCLILYVIYGCISAQRRQHARQRNNLDGRQRPQESHGIELQRLRAAHVRPVSAVSAAPRYEEHASDVALHEDAKLEMRDNRIYLAAESPPGYRAAR
jgi:hypothetical protein